MKRYNIRLSGTITTLSPMAIVPPGTEEIPIGGGSYKRIATATVYTDELRDTPPVITGSTLRGRLRRAAVGVYQSLSGEKIPLAEFHLNAVGGVKGAESEDSFDVVMRDTLRAKNPVLSLFGAGAPWLAGKARIDQAVPTHNVQTAVVGSARTEDGRRDNSFFQKLDDAAPEAWLALISGNADRTKIKQDTKKLQQDLSKARKAKNAEEAERISAALDALKKSEKAEAASATNSVGMPLSHEVLPAGVKLKHGVYLAAVTEEEAGLFFAAFNLFMKDNPAIGQHENLGYGLFACDYNVTMEEAGKSDPFTVGMSGAEPLGTLTASPYEGFGDVPARVMAAMQAFKTAFEANAYDFSVPVKPEKSVKEKAEVAE